MKKILLIAAAAGIALLGILLLLLALWMSGDDWQSLEPERLDAMLSSTVILDAAQQPIARLCGTENRIPVALGDISPWLIRAVVDVEDARFYEHPGVDVRRIAGALLADLRAGGPVQGASTLTQQLIKLTHLTAEKTVVRKVKEAVLALQAEQHFSKDEILTVYLNYIYFGNGTYGAEAASRGYFGKSAKDLTVSEAAVLAGIICAPGEYAPHLDRQAATERRNLVLRRMKEMGDLDGEQYETLIREPIELHMPEEARAWGWYVDAATREAGEKLGRSGQELALGGYRIETAMEPHIQRLCQRVLADESFFPANAGDGTRVQGALVVLNAKTGLAAALVGGRESTTQGFNRAIRAKRQPGSALKPFLVYAPAVELRGYTPETPVLDAPLDLQGYAPGNANGAYAGWVTLREALSRSLNTPAVRLMDEIGVETCKCYAEGAGIIFDEADRSLALALGGMTYGVSPMELAGAYTALAAGGTAHAPSTIKSIRDRKGEVLYRADTDGKRVFSEKTAFLVTDMLCSAVKNGTAQSLAGLGIPLAAKTGTVAYRGGVKGTRDLWTAAYNPDYVAVCWMGFDQTDDGHCMPQHDSGGAYAGRLLSEVFGELYRQGGAPEFTGPESAPEDGPDDALFAKNRRADRG